MLKLRRINLSGFRGILNPQELNLVVKGSNEPHSLVLFGLNSSGKTSFVDGLEWFLSEDSKIEWLQREEAYQKAYPHQAAKEKNIETFVEMDFYDKTGKIGTLTKTFNHNSVKTPSLSNEDTFKEIYRSAFVIRPYFRYLEVIDFVVSTAGKKYEKLAQWMGFESEFTFQEKIAVDILQGLKGYEKELADKISIFEQKVRQWINGRTAIEGEVLRFCNEILKQHKIDECKILKDVWLKIPEMSKKKIASSVGVIIEKFTRADNEIHSVSSLDEDLTDKLEALEKKIENFRKDSKLIAQINVIGLYTKALDILTKQTATNTECPVCGKKWEREKLMEHIRGELELLKKTKEEKEAIEQDASAIKAVISREINSVKTLITRYGEVKEHINEIESKMANDYLKILNDISDALGRIPADTAAQIKLNKLAIEGAIIEASKNSARIKKYKTQIQPSAEDTKLIEDIEKLTQVKNDWKSLEEAKAEREFATGEINKFYVLKDEVIKIIQDNVESRFKEISERIGKYFGILRDDKDITDIEIKLNKEKGKAAGRTAEIQLNYYKISVKPAYKVLSESLLNSLGLAIYFTCVKQFNDKCKFIVLDDIMNSLDIDKRDTLLDLIEQEFPDYQIIIFTHDLYWFQKIIRRFPDWIHKKIKGWDYLGGAKIDSITTTKEEIDECLSDSTRTEEAGWKLGRHAESILNELCEDLSAAVRYRYAKNDPPTMEELIDALHSRLKDKVKTHTVVKKVSEIKKYEPILRNFVSHARSNQPASLSPQDIKRASDEWFSLEVEFWCDQCNHFVEYHKSKDKIECHCGKKKFETPAISN